MVDEDEFGDFEPFHEGIVPVPKDGPWVRVNPPKAFFNKEAVVKLLGEAETVGVFIDHDTSRVGFDTETTEAVYTISLWRADDRGGAECRITKICKALGLSPDDVPESHKLPVERDDETGLVVVDMTPLIDRYGGEGGFD